MIHPSTLAGPNWFTGSFGPNNPFQQNTSPFFRNTPFQGQQGTFGFGANPFQGQQSTSGFGANPFQNPFIGNSPGQFQNTINEIIRQTVPTAFTSFGYQPTNGFQTPTFNWNTNGIQMPFNNGTFGPQLQNTPFSNWQTQSFFNELIRQTTNQVMQSFPQFSQTSPYQGTNWQNNPNLGTNPQQQLWNNCAQICQQSCYWSCQAVCQTIVSCAIECINQQNTTLNTNNPTNIQNIWNTCVQICQQACQQICQTICQSVITCATTIINQQNPTFGFNQQTTPFNFTQQNTPFGLTTPNMPFNFNNQNTPYNFNATAPQFSFTPGIPTGAGAF